MDSLSWCQSTTRIPHLKRKYHIRYKGYSLNDKITKIGKAIFKKEVYPVSFAHWQYIPVGAFMAHLITEQE